MHNKWPLISQNRIFLLFSYYFKIHTKIRRVNESLRIFRYETNLEDI